LHLAGPASTERERVTNFGSIGVADLMILKNSDQRAENGDENDGGQQGSRRLPALPVFCAQDNDEVDEHADELLARKFRRINITHSR
jgi:hypothetical protein